MKQKDFGEEQKDTQTNFRPFRSPETDVKPQAEKKGFLFDEVTRKDLFLMSFLSFLTGGVLILGLLFFTGAIAGNVALNFPGEKEVVVEETATPVIETPEETIEEIVEPIVEEVVEEEPVVEASDPCGSENQITLYLDEAYDHNGRKVLLKLASEFSAQISVGGSKGELISVGETMEINGMTLTMTDGDEAATTATIYIACE